MTTTQPLRAKQPQPKKTRVGRVTNLLLLTTGVTEIVFLALKLTGADAWSWVLVLSPLWVLSGAIEAGYITGVFLLGVGETLDDS